MSNKFNCFYDYLKNDVGFENLTLKEICQRMYNQGRETYEKEFGPLTHMSQADGEYRWLDDPWHWEYARNREV